MATEAAKSQVLTIIVCLIFGLCAEDIIEEFGLPDWLVYGVEEQFHGIETEKGCEEGTVSPTAYSSSNHP